MQFIGVITQFLKKHYEKIILCVVLLGLAAAAIWMGTEITRVKADVTQPPGEVPGTTKALVPLDLTADLLALAAVTNPPPVVLSGDHNLFNPVTWRRKANGELLKILKTGPDALSITNITPLYTVVAFDHSSDNVYIMDIQVHSATKRQEYAKKDEKPKSGLYIIRGIKGATDDSMELELEIPDTGETVSVSKGKPYKRVDGYTVDMKYEPESRTLLKERINNLLTLDSEQYKIVEITNNLVTVQAMNNGKKTTIPWNGNP